MATTHHFSPLHQTAGIGATDYWNDSCSIEELTYAIANGAVGATSNPTIVLAVLKKELPAVEGQDFADYFWQSHLERSRCCLEIDRRDGS